MKKVVATSIGFYNGTRVRPGTTLEVPDDFKGSWVAAVGTPAAAPAKPKPRAEPKTLSEMAKASVKSATDIV
jgi:hypothetical protein